MTLIESFLREHREPLGLSEVPRSGLLVTPRFRASSHVVWLALVEGSSQPRLVLKIPRLPARSAAICREAEQLRRIHALRPGGFDSVPRLLAFEEYRGWPVLAESALAGQPLDPGALRADPERAMRLVLDWLIELQAAAPPVVRDEGWFERALDAPARALLAHLELEPDAEKTLAECAAALRALGQIPLGAVLEHGDLSHPNLLLRPGGGLGVLDWELAEPDGLPAADLFFFLAYAAIARARADGPAACLAAVERAFFGAEAWAPRWAADYAACTGIGRELLTPLFVFSWLRCVERLRRRLVESAGALDERTRSWLSEHRYTRLLQHCLQHAHELRWEEGA